MSNATIHIYHVNGDAGKRERKLVRTAFVENTSGKRLTAKRASQILKRECPELDRYAHAIKTDEGWQASRSLKPTEKCPYFYIWLEAVIREDL